MVAQASAARHPGRLGHQRNGPGWVSGAEKGAGIVLVPPPELAAALQPERFSEETLFDIINGDADLYLKAWFVRLDTWRFNLKADPRR